MTRAGGGRSAAAPTAPSCCRRPKAIEALRCTGPARDADLRRRPAWPLRAADLSVRDPRGAGRVTATITFSYLASGFDWQANYIAHLSPDGASVDLFAWLTLASMRRDQLPQCRHPGRRRPRSTATRARTRIAATRMRSARRCAAGRTARPATSRRRQQPGAAAEIRRRARPDEDVVNGSGGRGRRRASDDRRHRACAPRQEESGRPQALPHPRAGHRRRQQPEAGRLPRAAARCASRLVYRKPASTPAADGIERARRAAAGHPQPHAPRGSACRCRRAGRSCSTRPRGRPILVGEGSIRDRAVGEDVEIEIGEATGVTGRSTRTTESDATGEDHVLTVTNDQAAPVRYEAEFEVDAGRPLPPPRAALRSRNGRPLWAVTVPANGSATLRYRARRAATTEPMRGRAPPPASASPWPARRAGAQTIVDLARSGPGRGHRLSRPATRRRAARSISHWLNGYALISETRRVDAPGRRVRHPLRGRRRRHPAAKRDRHRPSRRHRRAQPRRLSALARDPARPLARPARPPAPHLARDRRGAPSRTRSSAAARTAPSCCRPPTAIEALRCTGLPETLRLRRRAAPACRRGRLCRCGRARAGRSPPRSPSPIWRPASTGRPIMSPPVARRRQPRPVRLADPGQHATRPASPMPTPRRSPAGSTAATSTRERARGRAGSTLRCWPQGTTSDIPLEAARARRDGRDRRRATTLGSTFRSVPPIRARTGHRHRRHRDGAPAGESGRPQALPHPRAGHRRRQQPEAGRLPRAAGGARSGSSTAAGSTPAPTATRIPPSGCWSPATAPPRVSACRCPPAAIQLFDAAARPADPDRRGRRSPTARSTRMSRSSSARRPGVIAVDAETGARAATGTTMC